MYYIQSLWVSEGLFPGPPMDTKIHRLGEKKKKTPTKPRENNLVHSGTQTYFYPICFPEERRYFKAKLYQVVCFHFRTLLCHYAEPENLGLKSGSGTYFTHPPPQIP